MVKTANADLCVLVDPGLSVVRCSHLERGPFYLLAPCKLESRIRLCNKVRWNDSVELPVGEQAIICRSSELDADTAADAANVDPSGPDLSLLQGMELLLDLGGASTQWVVAGSVGAALVTRADTETLVWVIGSLFNAVFSKILKKGINQVRHSFRSVSRLFCFVLLHIADWHPWFKFSPKRVLPRVQALLHARNKTTAAAVVGYWWGSSAELARASKLS